MVTVVSALPQIMDPMHWLSAGGMLAAVVLPAILVIVFVETGLMFPLLPGDTLLFTGGLLAAAPDPPVSIWVLAPAVALTAVLGDQCAYTIGRRVGPALFRKDDSRVFKKRYATKSRAFFETHGPKTIVISRFLPIVRSFVPVVAGVSRMRYPEFLGFDVIGGITWGAGLTLVGYFLGNVVFVRNHLELMILLIGLLSILPGIFSFIRGSLVRRREPEALPNARADSDPACDSPARLT